MSNCGPCRVRVPITVADTDCVDLEGDGSPGSPLTAAPIIPAGAVVPNPAAPGLLPDTINGVVCTPTGLMAPQPGFPNFSRTNLPFGSNPDIIANTGGPIPWGPVGTDTLLNPNTDRVMLTQRVTQSPLVQFVLEPGATARVGYILDPLSFAIYFETWRMTNISGGSIETYALYPRTVVGLTVQLAGAPSVVDFQMFVEAIGFAGSSAITSFGQSGMSVTQFGVPT
jgi:hypothetical protein